MCEKTRKDKIEYEEIRANVGVNSIKNKMRDSLLRWFGHVVGEL